MEQFPTRVALVERDLQRHLEACEKKHAETSVKLDAVWSAIDDVNRRTWALIVGVISLLIAAFLNMAIVLFFKH